jgi:hypothetical protein
MTCFGCFFPVIGKVAWVGVGVAALVATVVVLVVSHDLSPHVVNTGCSVFTNDLQQRLEGERNCAIPDETLEDIEHKTFGQDKP